MPRNNYSKVVPAIYRHVLLEPGVRQCELYLYGMAPQSAKIEVRPCGVWQENSPLNTARGERFIAEFDRAFNLSPVMLRSGNHRHGGA